MSSESIPEDLRRFILTTIASVPFLEAILLLRSEPGRQWSAREVAERLYLSERAVSELLSDLHVTGIVARSAEEVPLYRYDPVSPDLRSMLERLSALYASHLIEVTNLIHSSVDRKAQQFADAFKWRKDN